MIWEMLSIQVVSDAKMRSFAVRKACSGKKAHSVAEQPSASASEGPKGQNIHSHRGTLGEIRHMTPGSP